MTTKTTHYDCCSMPTTELCPLHASAPEMLALLARYLKTAGDPKGSGDLADIDADARALLARFEGA